MVIGSSIKTLIQRTLNSFAKKDGRTLFFIPHDNCINDRYDIINYHSDNVLCLLHRMIGDKRFDGYHINLLVYDAGRKDEYEAYIRGKGFKGALTLVDNKDRLAFFNAFKRSGVVFTAHYYHKYLYKIASQKVICLGYFAAPFKDDFWKVKMLGYKKARKAEAQMNRVYDYHISTSDFCSRELALDAQIYLPKFLPLGFPRNDIFFEDNAGIKEKLFKAIGYTPKYVIAYAPTHRDYENEKRALSDKTLTHNRTLFGNTDTNEESGLLDLLEELDAVLVAKVHPAQARSILELKSNKRVVFLQDLNERCTLNLQELLAVSDLLITDYSSTFYDFLLTDRPIIHYCYDYEIQRQNRGFAYDPVLAMAAGCVVFDFDSMCDAIKGLLVDKAVDRQRMEFVRSLVFLHKDGKSADRIIDYFFGA